MSKLRRRSVSVIASLSALAIAGMAQVSGPMASAAAASSAVAAPATAPAAAAPTVVTVADCPGRHCRRKRLHLADRRERAHGRSHHATSPLVHKGDPVTTYKWMINDDDTGDPGTAAAPLLDSCLPPGRPAGGSADPDYADSCPWPSIRTTSGFRRSWPRATRPTSTTPRRSTTCPPASTSSP